MTPRSTIVRNTPRSGAGSSGKSTVARYPRRRRTLEEGRDTAKIFGSGSVRYRVHTASGDLPDGWSFGSVAAVAVGPKDEVHLFNRSAHPMIVLDRGGKLPALVGRKAGQCRRSREPSHPVLRWLGEIPGQWNNLHRPCGLYKASSANGARITAAVTPVIAHDAAGLADHRCHGTRGEKLFGRGHFHHVSLVVAAMWLPAASAPSGLSRKPLKRWCCTTGLNCRPLPYQY
jgi:hypothetical protein